MVGQKFAAISLTGAKCENGPHGCEVEGLPRQRQAGWKDRASLGFSQTGESSSVRAQSHIDQAPKNFPYRPENTYFLAFRVLLPLLSLLAFSLVAQNQSKTI